MPHPRSGKLNRQWNPVQAIADTGDGRGIGVSQLESGHNRPRTIEKERNSVDLPEHRHARHLTWVRHAERRHAPDYLAWNAQRLAAGDNDPKRWAPFDQTIGERRDSVDQMLAIVQQEQHLVLT